MSVLADYIKKYGQRDFCMMPFSEVDNLVFSMLAYLDYSKTSAINYEGASLSQVASEYFETHSYRQVGKLASPIGDAFRILELASKTSRFGGVIMSDYCYEANTETQFGAVTFDVLPNLRYVAFEGTDHLISGWREDFLLTVEYPTAAHRRAMRYLNRHVEMFGVDVLVGGHSKGGNLALVAAMELTGTKLSRIRHIYNNDGPGLRRKELKSIKYMRIAHKYSHIVPENSFFGVLLWNDGYDVVKNTTHGPRSHSAYGWEISYNHLSRGKLSSKSLALENSMLEWLRNHDDVERWQIINTVFGVLERNDITDTLILRKPSSIIRLLRDMKNIDENSKALVLDLVKYNFENYHNA